MNQILYTGENQYIKNANEKVKKRQNKPKNVLPIKNVILIFVICIIILGVCIICGSIYGNIKLNKSIEANLKPEIVVTENENDTVTIIVTHKKGIKNVTYQWNDENAITMDIEDEKKLMANSTIDLPEGRNTLKVIAIGVNDQESSITQQYILTKPKIEFNPVDNGVQIVASSGEKIDYVQYSWDDGEKQKIEVKKEKYEGIINAPKGKHILKIEVVNISGEKTEETKTIVGDTEPMLKIQSKLINGKATFVVDAEDDEMIETIEIIHNGGEKQTIEVKDKTYHKEIVMTEGEVNTIIVRVTNLNELANKKAVKFSN